MKRCLALILLPALHSPALAAESEPAPRFSRHVAAVFSRLGCNGGACHGAVQGKNGFRLTLFGADPALDYERLRHEYGGRRLDLPHPEASLLLRKATGQVAHGGGKHMEAGSRDYEILRRWIAAGAGLDPLAESQATLRVLPAENTVRPGQTYRLRVEAKFADGSVEDVTPLCSFTTLDRQVATVEGPDVRAVGPGDTALIVRYRAEPVLARVLVPRPSTEPFPKVRAHNFIDEHILAKLHLLNIPPAGAADDVTFLRRVSLDVTGELPTPAEIRAFLANRDPDKRNRKIDELLTRPGHAALWTLEFCDLLKASDFGVYADGVTKEMDAPRFQAWVRARLEENIPYDQFVERILTATSREGRSLEAWGKEVAGLYDGFQSPRTDVDVYRKRKTLDLYWQRRGANGLTGTLQVAHTFLGLRLQCAQCHRHPHDVWQQDDLLSFANFFMRVRGSGFQGDNEKRFPTVAAQVKKLEAEGKKLLAEAKKLREGKVKKLQAEVNKARAGKDRARLKELEKQFAASQREAAELERRSKNQTEIGRRMLHAEIHHLTDRQAFATVVSPLGTQTSKTFRLLGSSEALTVAKDQDPRPLVMAWMRRPDNPYFAKAIVNRVWAHYFGRGLVDPVDNLSAFNPPTHPQLLNELCRQFIAHHYDLRWLHRLILQSRTYQQSSTATAANEMDRTNYAYFAYRRLPAEVLLDALNRATGTTEDMGMKFWHWPEELKSIEIPFTPANTFVAFMLENFGRPRRNSGVQCDCERDSSASILQVLSFANHPRIAQKIADPHGQVARILKEKQGERERIEELFLGTLSRLPAEAEYAACSKYVKEAPTPEKGLQGVLWSLLNTREFVLQH